MSSYPAGTTDVVCADFTLDGSTVVTTGVQMAIYPAGGTPTFTAAQLVGGHTGIRLTGNETPGKYHVRGKMNDAGGSPIIIDAGLITITP